jgi:hypothetical protein
MSDILWVNPVETDSFDDETADLVEAIRAPHHQARVRHLDHGPPTSNTTTTSTRRWAQCSS